MTGETQVPRPQDKVRNLSHSGQQKLAREGDQGERTALERIYGKAVWEPLLQNSRISVVEVARISCKGSLPKPLIELIISNASWLSNAQVRRGLLTNPRLGREQIVRVLRAMPRHELKLAPKQSIYGSAVREAARKLAGAAR
jgi:hypothetical protein